MVQKEDEQILYNGREKGEFRVIIPLNPSTAVLKDQTPKVELKEGLVCFYYEL